MDADAAGDGDGGGGDDHPDWAGAEAGEQEHARDPTKGAAIMQACSPVGAAALSTAVAGGGSCAGAERALLRVGPGRLVAYSGGIGPAGKCCEAGMAGPGPAKSAEMVDGGGPPPVAVEGVPAAPRREQAGNRDKLEVMVGIVSWFADI